jgi:transcriptional regulator
MVLRTLEALGPLHGYGLARRIEQTSGDLLQLNYGTLYPALLKLEQEGFIRSHWGTSENNRRAKFYELTKAGQRQVKKAAAEWEETTAILFWRAFWRQPRRGDAQAEGIMDALPWPAA